MIPMYRVTGDPPRYHRMVPAAVLDLVLADPALRRELQRRMAPSACDRCRARGGSIQPARGRDGYVWRTPSGRGGPGCVGCPREVVEMATAVSSGVRIGGEHD